MTLTKMTAIFCSFLSDFRKMEPAWEKVNGCKFALVEYQDKKGEFRPCYQLTKTECLYIATKFNDEARAHHIVVKLRWWVLIEPPPSGR
ncbi:MAG: Rha family transcriptional regulator [Bacteroidaceae bacterium]|nr:Rha family transcriptional regulator [Bacteroidaceae bacterium]